MSQAPGSHSAGIVGELLIDWNVDAGTLGVTKTPHAWLTELYETFGGELRAVVEQAVSLRRRMVANAYTADLSDRESELLYLLVRALRPDVVVEMSPCHGYSTGYLLAALTANGQGELHSYEIVENVRGRPIDEVVRSNLPADVDQDRLYLHVGDARDADIPAAQFAFVDSNHEAYFAAWYRESLLTRFDLTMVHDIVVRTGRRLVPKGHLLGVREQYVILEALARADRPLAAAAEAASSVAGAVRHLPARHELPGSDRAVLTGRLPSDPLLAQTMQSIGALQVRIGTGERPLAEVGELIDANEGFLRQMAFRLLPAMGYRVPGNAGPLPSQRVEQCRTLSSLVAAVEAALAAADYDTARRAVRGLRGLNGSGRLLAREIAKLLP